jgi:hypothetical protein
MVVGKVKSSATQARSRPTRSAADAGVRKCMDLMAAGMWVSGRSHADVAFEFGVAPATVKDWATSASRVLRLAVQADPEDLRARLLTTLENIVCEAMKTFELKAAVSAVAEQAKLLGLIVQKTQEVPMSEDQARAKYLELTGREWSEGKPS